MKKNRFIKHGACLSLMAMLPTMFGPSLMMQTVEAQTKGGDSDPIGSVEYVQFFADQAELWQNMWGSQYSNDQSMMTMTESPILPGLWNVDAHQFDTVGNDMIINSGSFQVTAWYELVSVSETQIDDVSGAVILATVTTYAVSGVLTGSTGFSQTLAAAVSEADVSNLMDPEFFSNSFVLFPLQSTLDIAEATQIATDLFNAMAVVPVPVLIGNAEINTNGGGTAAQTEQDSDQFDGTVCGIPVRYCLEGSVECDCLCAGIYYTDRNVCAALLAVALIACTAAYAKYLAVCSAACVILVPEAAIPCIAFCNFKAFAAYTACVATASLLYWKCMEEACGDFIDCLMVRCGWGQP